MQLIPVVVVVVVSRPQDFGDESTFELPPFIYIVDCLYVFIFLYELYYVERERIGKTA